MIMKFGQNFSTHEYLILTEFHNHWVKIVDFLIKKHMYHESLDWGAQVCIENEILKTYFKKKEGLS